MINRPGYFVLAVMLLAAMAIIGCNGGDGGASDWAKPTPVTIVSNLRGTVLPPVVGASSASLHPAFALLSLEGTEVYVEEKPEFRTTVASSGSFLLAKLPVGRYHLVAQTLSGTTSYRQRSDLIDLTGKFETQELSSPIPLAIAPYKVKMNVTDIISNNPVYGARLQVWGVNYLISATGDVEIGPLPKGFWPVRVEAAGYRTVILHIGFQELRRAELQVKLTPLSATDKNQAPLVEIEQPFTTIRANESVNLYAAGSDPDGDLISYNWSSSRGGFLQNTGASVVYNAPPSSGSVEITLTGKDSKSATAKAVLRLDVLPGSNIPVNPNNRAPLAATAPFPENLSQNLGTEIVLRWAGSDPDNDPLVYDVLLATQGADLKQIAQNISENSFKVTSLKPNQIYFWQVISRDVYEAISPDVNVWQFKTGDSDNAAPNQPANPVPDDLAFDQLPSLRFTWTGGDPDINDVVTYSFLLGLDPETLELKGTTRKTAFEVEGLELGKTYYWRVVAADDRGKETKSPLWRFNTYSPANQAPGNPVVAYPASGAVGIPADAQIRWIASDPDGDAITADVFIGSEFPLTKVAGNVVGQSYLASTNYRHLTRYYWQVVIKDSRGLTNADSPVWSFTTSDKTNLLPNVPQAITPANQATSVALKPVFSWSGGDPDGDTVVYDFYLDTSLQPDVLKAEDLGETRWQPVVELNPATQYYWRVTAKDSSGGERNSPIFSFITSSGADTTPPTIVSIAPANGATGVSQSSEMRVVFSEPVNQASVLAALTLVPAVQGTWTWENDSSIRFLPTSPWLPGSFNRLQIAATVRDIANNTIGAGANSSFTVTSAIPVPASFRSSGFPITANNGETVRINVPGLISGGKSFALTVASPNAANATVRGSMPGGSVSYTDPGSAFREFEKNLAGREFPTVMSGNSMRASIVVQAAPQINVSESFFIPAYGSVATTTAFPDNVIQATCLGLTDKTAIYVDNLITSPSNTLITEVRKRFEEVVQPRIRDFFGNEPGVGPDGDSRLTILLTDSMADGIAGIFYGVDLFSRNPSDIQLRESNGRKIFYLKYSLTSDITRYGTMAHEFQHMVNYWQKRYYGGSNLYEATWLNEGMSKFAEEVCGYGVLEGDQNTALLIKLSQENFNSLSLTNWSGINSYGLSYLFVKFLSQENRYGTTYRDITRKLVNSALTGTANIESVTGESFSTTLARMAASLYLNRHASVNPQDYGLKGLNLTGTYSGVTLPGFKTVIVPVGGTVALSLAANQFKCFEKTSTGAATTDLEFSPSSGNVKIWSWDQRP